MIFGVDGTGPFSDADYASSMARSFVSQLCAPSTAHVKMYWRGPDALDLFKGPSPQLVADTIRNAVAPGWRPPPNPGLPGLGFPPAVFPSGPAPGGGPIPPVFLTGYSRGGATVIDAAVILKKYGIPVEAMFLFDAVTRSAWLSGAVIPSNVKVCYHAMRDPDARSRRSFGNSKAQPEAGVIYEKKIAFTTHAGMGGVPWGENGIIRPAATPYWSSDLPAWAPTLTPGIGFAPLMTIPSPQDVAEDMVRRNPTRYGDKIYEGAPDWAFTEVTVPQEQLGMDAVRLWMWERLRKHGVVK